MNIKDYQDYLNSSNASQSLSCDCIPDRTVVSSTTSTSSIIDPSLSIANAAADARVVGLRFTADEDSISQLNKKASQLANEIDCIEKAFDALKSQQLAVDDKAKIFGQLEENLLHLTTDLRYFKNQVNGNFCGCEKRLTNLEKNTQCLEGKIASSERALQHHHNAIQLADGKIENIQESVTHLNERVHRLYKDDEALDNRIHCLEHQMQKTKDDIADLRVQLAALAAKLDAMLVDDGNLTLKDLHNMILKLDARLDKFTCDINDKLQKAIKDLDKEFEIKIHAVDDRVDVNAKAIENLSTQLKCLKANTEHDEIKRRLDKVEKDISSANKNIVNASKTLNDKIEDTEDKLNKRITNEIKALDDRQDVIDKAITSITQQLGCVQKCNDSSKAISELKTSISNLDTRLDNFSVEIVEKVNKVSKECRNKLSDEATKIRAELDQVEDTLDDRIDVNAKAIASLTNKLNCIEKCAGGSSSSGNSNLALAARIEEVNDSLTTKINSTKNDLNKSIKNLNTTLSSRIDKIESSVNTDHKAFSTDINKLNVAMARLEERAVADKNALEETQNDLLGKIIALKKNFKNHVTASDEHFLEIEKRLDDSIEGRIDKNFRDIAILFEKFNNIGDLSDACKCADKLDALTAKIDALTAKNSALENKIQEQNATINDLKAQVETLDGRIDDQDDAIENVSKSGVQSISVSNTIVQPDENGKVNLDMNTYIENYFEQQTDVDGGDLDGTD